MGKVHVRPFEPKDNLNQIHEIFRIGMNSVKPKFASKLYWNWFPFVSLPCHGLALYLAFRNINWIQKSLLFLALNAFPSFISFLTSYFVVEKYIQDSLNSDMHDIEDYYFKQSLGTSCFWVAEVDNEIIGMVALDSHVQQLMSTQDLQDLMEKEQDRQDGWIPKRKAKSRKLPPNHASELRRLSVHPNHRKKGVAELLLNALIEFAKKQGNTQIYLELTEHQEEGRKFYFKHGFRLVYEKYVHFAYPLIMRYVLKLKD